ncbi:MAG TPA: 2-dehydropantoate 2-reductase [Anaeromyxobacteraceae bacterium]|nr:2-dehydropantoate 2-reductase [Anaeromyxobacteraceae bacterium]
MRIVIVGAGGVGGVVGGFLARAGIEVAFVARGAQLAAMRDQGLRVESPRASFHLPHVEVSQHPNELAPADAVIVAVKGWQVAEVAPKIGSLLRPNGFAVPLENGVDAVNVLAGSLGRERVVGGLCHVFAWVEAPGRVRHGSDLLRVTLGEWPRGRSDRVDALAEALRGAGVDSAASDDVEAACWEKFTLMAPFGGVGAVTRAPIGIVRALPQTRGLLAAAAEEVAVLGRARGVRLDPDAPRKALALIDRVAPNSTASMQRDIQAGRPSELYDQNGAVVRMGEETGVPVPTNAFLFAALLPQEQAARRG